MNGEIFAHTKDKEMYMNIVFWKILDKSKGR